MAEGFARAHGSDVIEAQSAGLAPALAVAPLTHQVMLEKDIDLGALYPRKLDEVTDAVDLVINMSGQPVSFKGTAVVEDWDVRDPIGESEEVYREVRDEIERRVMKLIASMRARKPPRSEDRPAATRVDTQGCAPGK